MTSERTENSIFLNSIVPEDVSVEEALRHMNAEAALIVDSDGRLAGILTDGDIRRSLLRGCDLRTPVRDVMSRNPMKISDGLSHDEIVSIMLERKIRHLPVVDEDGRPVALELLKNQYDASVIAQAVLMAGGKGMRLRPLTEDTPKPLLKVDGTAIIDNVINGLKAHGIGDVVISVNYLGQKIKDHVSASANDISVGFVDEEKELGTAGALSLLDPRPKSTFLVMNADLLTQVDFNAFLRFHRESGNDMSVCVRKIKEKIPFGVVSIDSDSKISTITEKPDYECIVNAGIYMLEPHIIDLIPKNTFFDMVSLIKAALKSGSKVAAFPIYEYWRDIGRHQEMQAASNELKAMGGFVKTTGK